MSATPDSTNASRTLLFDIAKLRWDEQLCDLFEVPTRSLAEVRETLAARMVDERVIEAVQADGTNEIHIRKS